MSLEFGHYLRFFLISSSQSSLRRVCRSMSVDLSERLLTKMKTVSLVLSVSSRRVSPCLMTFLESELVSCSLPDAPLRVC